MRVHPRRSGRILVRIVPAEEPLERAGEGGDGADGAVAGPDRALLERDVVVVVRVAVRKETLPAVGIERLDEAVRLGVLVRASGPGEDVPRREGVARTGQTKVESGMTFLLRSNALPTVGPYETGYSCATRSRSEAVSSGKRPAKVASNCCASSRASDVVSFRRVESVKI